MFLHLSVSHSVHRGVYLSMQLTGVYTLQADPPPMQTLPVQTPPGQTPPQTATEVGGTHPIRMHSCLILILICN